MNSEKVKENYLTKDMGLAKNNKEGFPYCEYEKIVLGNNFGTRLSVNLPNSNSIIYERIKNSNDKKRQKTKEAQ